MKVAASDIKTFVTLTTLGVLLVLALFWGLSTLSTPRDARGRLQRVQAILVETQRSVGHGDQLQSSPRAICPNGAMGAAVGKAVVDEAAAFAKVELTEERLAPASEVASSMVLETLRVDITAKGPEGSLRTFLQALALKDPVILADQIDLNTDGADVSLKVKGRLLCHVFRTT